MLEALQAASLVIVVVCMAILFAIVPGIFLVIAAGTALGMAGAKLYAD